MHTKNSSGGRLQEDLKQRRMHSTIEPTTSLPDKMRRHAMKTMIAVLCLLLFSGSLAAEKNFGGGGGGYDAGGGGEQQQQQQQVVEATPQADAGAATTETAGGGGGGYSTPSEPAPSTPAVAEQASSGGEASGSSGGDQAAASTTTGGEQPGTTTGGEQLGTTTGGEQPGGLDPAGDPEVGLNEKAINEIVNEHNVFRAKEHVPPLTWNATLAKFSQQYAETLKGNCQQIHSTSPYGENLMEGSTGLTWKITVDGWSDEKKNYHYGSNTCDPGKMCGHYTAVVWKTTTSVGCGRIKCNSGDIIIMCSYWPPGNYDGVKPY